MPFANGPHVFSIANIILFAPRAPGVYGASGAVEMIYVGKSEDIQGLKKLFANPFKRNCCRELPMPAMRHVPSASCCFT